MIVSLECFTCALSLLDTSGIPREDCENFWRAHHTHAMCAVRVVDRSAHAEAVEPEEPFVPGQDHVPGTCSGCGQKSVEDPCRICGRSRSQWQDVYVGKVRIR